MRIRAYVILCKSRQDGIQFASQQAGEWSAGPVANFVFSFDQCKHYSPVPDDVRVVKTPAFAADPDLDIERALNVIPSWKQLRFVTMDGVLYPCIDIKVDMVHHGGRPHPTITCVLAFGLTAVIEAKGVMIFDKYRKGSQPDQWHERFSLVISEGSVVDAG